MKNNGFINFIKRKGKKNKSICILKKIFEREYPEGKFASKEEADGAVISDMSKFRSIIINEGDFKTESHNTYEAAAMCISLAETFNAKITVYICDADKMLYILLCAKKFIMTEHVCKKLNYVFEASHSFDIHYDTDEDNCVISVFLGNKGRT